MNLYRYVGDPILEMDPLGLKWYNPCDWNWSKIGKWSKGTAAAGGAVLATITGANLYYKWQAQADANAARESARQSLNENTATALMDLTGRKRRRII